MLRVVIDPGVLIAARLSSRAAPAELIRRWLAGQIEIIVSPQLCDELNEVLHRDKFRRWLSVGEADAFVEFLREHAALERDPPAESGHTPDPDDDYLVTLARAVRADVLVSGDRDLLGIPNPSPPVTTPRKLVNLLDEIDPPDTY